MVFLQNFIFQLLFSFGVIIAFGFLIAELNRAWCRMLGSKGLFAMRATGIIGTPIHETGHAIFCLIFGHKIVDMKLYQIDNNTGVLGYVNNSFNKRNIYHQIGNFFIGIGPIIFGSLVLMGLMILLIPDTFKQIFSTLNNLDGISYNVFDPNTYLQIVSLFSSIFLSIFSFSNFANWLWWIFIILGVLISTHMTLSKADIDGSIWGFIVLVALMLIVDAIIFFISPALLAKVTTLIVKCSFYVISLLAIGVIVLILLLLVTFILGGFRLKRN